MIEQSAQGPEPRPLIARIAFVACGIWLIGLGLYFMFLRSSLLPEDLRYIGAGPGQLQLVLPGLERWTHRVFTVMGGFMTGAGVLTIFVTLTASAAGERWTWSVLALAGIFTVGTMSLTNFQLNSDFKWLLLIPSLLWVVGLASHPRSRRSSS